MKKLLFTFGVVSLLNATPSPITTKEIAYLKSTEVIADDATITDQSQEFDQAVSKCLNDNIIRCPWVFSEQNTMIMRGLNILIDKQRFGEEVTEEESSILSSQRLNFFDMDVLTKVSGFKSSRDLLEMHAFVFKCIEEYENYNQQGVNEHSFYSNEKDIFKYHAIFNQTLDYLGEDGKIPNFIALFSLSYVFQSFRNELEAIMNNGGSGLLGDASTAFKDEEIIAKLLGKANMDHVAYSHALNSLTSTNDICIFTESNIREMLKLSTYSLAEVNIIAHEHLREYPLLIIEKLAGIFLKSLNINYINMNGFSHTFLDIAKRLTDLPVLTKALNK